MMADEKQTPQEPYLLIAGRPATKQERQRILGGRTRTSDPKARATKHIQQVDRGFKLMR